MPQRIVPYLLYEDVAAAIEWLGDAFGFEEVLRVTARIRVPLTFIFEMLRTINEAMSRYEADYGPVDSPRRRGEEGA